MQSQLFRKSLTAGIVRPQNAGDVSFICVQANAAVHLMTWGFTMATTKLMTADDLWELGESWSCRRELIRGELREMPPAGDEHGEISASVLWFIMRHVRQHKLGTVHTSETGFFIDRDPDVVLAPDAAFTRAERLRADRDRSRFVEVPPDLVVEVNSPSDRISDVTDKVMIYLGGGVQMVWVVDPRRRIITVYSPDRTAKIFTADDHLDGGDVLPGFRLAVSEIFEE